MTSSSYSFVNGKPQSSRQTSFTYVLRATKVGTFSIPAAKVSANGKSYTSNSVKVTVVQGEASSSGSQQSGAGSGSASRSSASSSSSEDLFIRQSLSRTSVYEGEATELVTKVYARVSLQSLSDVVAPKLSDFVVNDLGDNNITFKTEYIDGKEYQVGELSRKSIIPQRSGRIIIEPTEAEFVVKRNVRRNTGSIFDDFFGDVQMTKQRVKTSSLTLNVKPLPDGKPTGFSGGVGQFKFNVEVSLQRPRWITVSRCVSLSRERATSSCSLCLSPNSIKILTLLIQVQRVTLMAMREVSLARGRMSIS